MSSWAGPPASSPHPLPWTNTGAKDFSALPRQSPRLSETRGPVGPQFNRIVDESRWGAGLAGQLLILSANPAPLRETRHCDNAVALGWQLQSQKPPPPRAKLASTQPERCPRG